MPIVLPSAVSSTGRAPHRGASTATSIGKRSPLKTCPGMVTLFQPQSGFRTSGQRDGVDGDAQLLRLPDGARHAAQILIAVGDQQQARHHAGRQRRRAVADGALQIRAAPRRARGVAQLPAVLGLLFERDQRA